MPEKGMSGSIGIDYGIGKNDQLGFVMDYAWRFMDRGNEATTLYRSAGNGSVDSIEPARSGGNTENGRVISMPICFIKPNYRSGQSLKVMMSSYWYNEDRDGTLETVYKADKNSNAVFRNLLRQCKPAIRYCQQIGKCGLL